MTVKNRIKHFNIRWLLVFCIAALLIYSTLVLVSYFLYAPHTFKNATLIGPVSVSGQTSYEAKTLLQKYLDTVTVTINYDGGSITDTASALGVNVTDSSITQLQNKQRTQQLFIPFVHKKSLDLPLTLNQQFFAYTTQSALNDNGVAVATPARYSYDTTTLTISPGTDGYGVDYQTIYEQLESAVSSGMRDINLTTSLTTQPPFTQNEQLERLKDQALDIIGKNHTVNANEVAILIDKNTLAAALMPNQSFDALIIPAKASSYIMQELATKITIPPTNEVISSYVSGKAQKITQKGVVGKTPNNTELLATKLKDSVDANEQFMGTISWDEVPYTTENITVNDLTVYRYKISTWGVTQANIDEFRAKVAETLASPKGWQQADISFTEVSSGEQFEIVLSEASELPARYPTICDATYSCRVGKYVIINDDRWRLATPPWTGTIRDYQHMVINHEVGHWLGQKHIFCSAAGQLAPVMQQQSINLTGCLFNPWPLPYEIADVRAG